MLPRALAVLLLTTATAAGQTRVEVIVDASEATLAPWSETSVFASVRAAVVAVVDEAANRDEGPQLGLRVAGGGDNEVSCEATRLVVPAAAADRQRWTDALDSVEPGGDRPLFGSVIAAIDDVGRVGEHPRIVVVTAGGDGCAVGPQQVAAALAASGASVELRLVGLDLDQPTIEGFGAISLCNAEDADDLLPALRWAVFGGGESPPDGVCGNLPDPSGDSRPDTAESPPEASLSAPSTVKAGEAFEVSWSGPEAEEDFISLALRSAADDAYLEWARTADGNPAVLRAPATPGGYELRYVDGERGTTWARAPIEVAAVTVELRVAAVASAGRRIEVVWTGPAAPGDILTISPADAAPHRYLDWVDTSTGSPVTLAAPNRPGTYEIRYVAGGGREVVARVVIEVRP